MLTEPCECPAYILACNGRVGETPAELVSLTRKAWGVQPVQISVVEYTDPPGLIIAELQLWQQANSRFPPSGISTWVFSPVNDQPVPAARSCHESSHTRRTLEVMHRPRRCFWCDDGYRVRRGIVLDTWKNCRVSFLISARSCKRRGRIGYRQEEFECRGRG